MAVHPLHQVRLAQPVTLLLRLMTLGPYSPTSRFKDINKLIKLKNLLKRTKCLKGLKKVNTDEADRLNLLVLLQENQVIWLQQAIITIALALNPRHTGALEYQGELFIQLGKIELAKANLAKTRFVAALQCRTRAKKAIENW